MISKSQYRISLIILLIALLASQGCAGIFPTATPMAVPIATETVTISTTKTPTPKLTNTNTPDYLATADFIETASINTIISTVQPVVLASYPSPDGKWRVDVIRYDCINYANQDYLAIIAYEQLKIINLSDGTEKIVHDQRQNCDGIGGGGLKGLLWSPNNRYYYYTDWREGFPESCGNYIVPTVYRFDTTSEEIITVGGGHISPDETKLAMWQENEIVIWDLDIGEVGRVQGLAPFTFNGAISWSPYGQSLVYLQTTFDCATDYGKTYLTRLDLADMSQTLLLRVESPGLGGISWDISNEITLMDGDGRLWNFNLKSRDIIPLLTPTVPVPAGVFALMFYPPLIMEYDASEWTMLNYLQSRNLKTCAIGEQGPTGDFPATPEVVQLDSVRYQVITFTDSPPGSTIAYYIEDNSLIGFNYEMGTSVLVVRAISSEWEDCKVLAEKVLATLHVP